MKILVAGGAGYLGSVLVPMLIEHGYEVDVIDLLWFGNHLPENVNVTQKELFHCTIDDLGSYEQIVFLAGLSNDPMAEYNPAKNFIDNGALPSYVAYLAKAAGVRRFIYASSCSVYGYTVDKLYDEESPASSAYPYGISKLQGERGVLQLLDSDFSVISLRQGTVSGFSPRMRFDLIVNTMFKTAMTQKKVIVNNPSIWRPIFHVRDAANAFLRAIQASYAISGVFNVTSDNFTVGQVGDLVMNEVQKRTGEKIKMEIYSREDYRNYKISIEKAKTYLGFTPISSITDIIDDLYDHLDSYGDYEQDEYYNIRTFKKIDAGVYENNLLK
jgi:nucleoside-diphosphate-sugar epimerase